MKKPTAPQPNARTTAVEEAVVVFDTNILLSLDPAKEVCREFVDFLKEANEKADLELCVPDLVVMELVQRGFSICSEALKTTENKLETINGATGKTYTTNAKEGQIRGLIDQRIRKWLKRNRTKVIPTPYDISVKELEEQAVKGKPPFEEYDKNKRRGDNGIKDFLILKTIVRMKKPNDSRRLVFVTNDELLQKAFDLEFDGRHDYVSYPDLKSYTTDIDMAHDGVSKIRREAIHRMAPKRFFDSEKKSGFWFSLGIKEQVLQKLEDEIAGDGSERNFLSSLGYKPTPLVRYKLSRSKFTGSHEGRYSFSAMVKCLKPFRHLAEPDDVFGIALLPDKVTLSVVLEVQWSSKVTSNGSFRDAKVGDIPVVGRYLDPPLGRPAEPMLDKTSNANLARLMEGLEKRYPT